MPPNIRYITAATTLLALWLASTACATEEEPSSSPSATASPLATRTPRADEIEIVEGLYAEEAELPAPPPAGLIAVSKYLEFRYEYSVPITLTLPVTSMSSVSYAFYSFDEGLWQRIAPAQVSDAGPESGGFLAQGNLDPVPRNTVVFAES